MISVRRVGGCTSLPRNFFRTAVHFNDTNSNSLKFIKSPSLEEYKVNVASGELIEDLTDFSEQMPHELMDYVDINFISPVLIGKAKKLPNSKCASTDAFYSVVGNKICKQIYPSECFHIDYVYQKAPDELRKTLSEFAQKIPEKLKSFIKVRHFKWVRQYGQDKFRQNCYPAIN